MIKPALLALSFAVALSACNQSKTTQEGDGTATTEASPADSSATHGNSHDGQGEEGHRSEASMMAAMSSMTADMKAMKMTGDADYDFAAMMKRHHNAAVQMIQAYLPECHQDDVKAMATKMLADQKKEIGMFDAFLAKHTPTQNSPAFGQQAMAMMANMPPMGNMPADHDKHFVTMMVPHHQSAIDMSQAYLNVAKNAEMKGMAKSIAATQQQEIKEMQAFLSKPAGNAGHAN